MTADERSGIQHIVSLMLTEINNLYHTFDGPAKHNLNLAYRHLNRAAIDINRVPLENEMGISCQGSTTPSTHAVSPNS